MGKEGDFQKDFAIKKRMDTDENTGKVVEIEPHVLDDNNRYFASTSYTGCFSIDVNFSGRFFKGNTAGFKNIAESFPLDDYHDKIESRDEFEIVLKKEIRQERIQKLLKSFPYLSGGARQATVFSDLAPKFVVYCVTNSGNHLFQEISTVYEHFNVKSLIEGVTDFKDNLKSNIYIALKNGFLDNKRQEIIEAMQKYNQDNTEGFKFDFNDNLGEINKITKKFAEEVIPKLFEVENI
jgi:CRISPR-associated protein Cst2